MKPKLSLSIITIHRGNLDDLKKTLKSIDNQNFIPDKHLIIINKNYRYQTNFLKKNNRIFIFNKDTSIYNAMNLGLKFLKNYHGYLMFLNSGDTFFKKVSLYQISKLLSGCNRPIIMKQVLINKKNLFFIKKKFFTKKNYRPHGSFIIPPGRKNFFLFDEKRKIDADGKWMDKIIKKNKGNFIKRNINLTYHALGGVSTNPNIKSLKIYLKINFFLFFKEFIKFIIQIFMNEKYYRIIYFYKYNLKKKC